MSGDAAGEYPSGSDVEWVAVDRAGRVGVFTTGGTGPIPRAYLQSQGAFELIHDALWAMPERTQSEMLVHVPRPDDFEAFARRGFFAFDWADVSRVSEASGLYEAQARPAVAVEFDELEWPEEVRQIVRRLRSQTLDFEHATVDVREFDCAQEPQ